MLRIREILFAEQPITTSSSFQMWVSQRTRYEEVLHKVGKYLQVITAIKRCKLSV